jgi:hypothetical protein
MKDFPFVESILRQVFNLKDDSAIFASTSLEQTNESGTPEDVAFSVRPARTYSNGCKSPDRPDSGKVTAKGKGVRRETESKGSRRQKVGPMNKNLVQGWKAGAMLQ